MANTSKKVVRRQKIRYKIRNKISGTPQRPRLSIYRSNKAIYAQLIDDIAGHTLATANSNSGSYSGTQTEIAKEVGKALASKAKAAGVEVAVFDRSGYLYHGRVKALAEGVREGGLQI